jgi:hypothetical protein
MVSVESILARPSARKSHQHWQHPGDQSADSMTKESPVEKKVRCESDGHGGGDSGLVLVTMSGTHGSSEVMDIERPARRTTTDANVRVTVEANCPPAGGVRVGAVRASRLRPPGNASVDVEVDFRSSGGAW